MEKKIIFISMIIFILLIPTASFAKQGIGLVFGEPTGFSYKAGNLAIGLGWSFASDKNRIDATIDWWLINKDFVETLDWYLGVGIKGKFGTDTVGVGVRVPIGIQWWIADELELFAELAPGISLFPDTNPDLSGGIGLRYYFQ